VTEATVVNIQEALTRAAGYRLLAHLLTPPEDGWREQAHALASEAGIPAGVLPSSTGEDANIEHQHLFAPTGPVSPCASDHVGEGFVGKGSVLGDVAGFYAAFGYEPVLREPPDHFASLFGFLALLALKEGAMAHEGDEEEAEVARQAETDLLAAHVLPHLAPFQERLTAMSPPDGTYQRVCDLLTVRLVEDSEQDASQGVRHGVADDDDGRET
jgi:TorA maturation chaperone TorD